MQKIGLIILIASLLTSCASYYTTNGEKKYLQSRNGPALVVPPPLTRDNVSEFYVLPEQNQNAAPITTAPPQD